MTDTKHHKDLQKGRSQFAPLLIGALLFLAFPLQGCVSSTLNTAEISTNASPEPEKPPSYDPEQRKRAVSEIRQKAETRKSGKKTDINDNGDGESAPLTAEEVAAKKRELEASADAQETVLDDRELAEKQRAINEMRKSANSHYNDAVKKIEN